MRTLLSFLIIAILAFSSISCERLEPVTSPSARAIIGSATEVKVTGIITLEREGVFESGATRYKITFDQTECRLLEFVDPKEIETGTILKGILVEEGPPRLLKYCYIKE